MAPVLITNDLYAILNVKQDATTSEITAAYRKLARELHPDKNDASDATTRFQELGQAYEILKDTASRQEYDKQRKPQSARPAQTHDHTNGPKDFVHKQQAQGAARRSGSGFGANFAHSQERAYREEQQRAYQEQVCTAERQREASKQAYNEKQHSHGHSSWRHAQPGQPQQPFYNHKAAASKLAYDYRPSFTDNVWPWHVYAAEFRRCRTDIKRRQEAAAEAWCVQHKRTLTAQQLAEEQGRHVEQMWQTLQQEEKHVQYIARTAPFGSGEFDRAMEQLLWSRQRFQQENEAHFVCDAEFEHEKERSEEVIAEQMDAAEAEILCHEAEDQAWMAWCEALADQRSSIKRWHEQPYSFFSGKPFWDPYGPPNGCNHVARPVHHQHSHRDCLKGERAMLSQIPKVYCPWCSELLCGWCGRTWEAVRGRYEH